MATAGRPTSSMYVKLWGPSPLNTQDLHALQCHSRYVALDPGDYLEGFAGAAVARKL